MQKNLYKSQSGFKKHVSFLAVCLSFRLVRNLFDSFREGFSPRRVAEVVRRASLVRTQADSPRRTGMTVFEFCHAFINRLQVIYIPAIILRIEFIGLSGLLLIY
jgi:hypothetical protein